MMYTNAIAVLMQAILSASEVELPVFSPIALAHNLQIFIMRFYSAASRKRSSNKKNDNWESENARGSNECFKNCLFLQIISHVFFSRTPSSPRQRQRRSILHQMQVRTQTTTCRVCHPATTDTSLHPSVRRRVDSGVSLQSRHTTFQRRRSCIQTDVKMNFYNQGICSFPALLLPL